VKIKYKNGVNKKVLNKTSTKDALIEEIKAIYKNNTAADPRLVINNGPGFLIGIISP
jgi:hypothetical protein